VYADVHQKKEVRKKVRRWCCSDELQYAHLKQSKLLRGLLEQCSMQCALLKQSELPYLC